MPIKQQIDVSIIIPTFNRLWCLPRAVASCRDSAVSVEIIVVDDGSSDGTWEWLSAQKDVVALKQENWGKGWAVNMSSGGVLVASKNPFIVGTLVEMSIEWPSRLEGRIPLQLIATGRVLRGGASFFAASFERHEFRTRNKPVARSRGHLIEKPPSGILPG